MSNQSGSKKLKSTFAIHHGAPVWILEEVESEEVGNKAPNGKKLEELLCQLATSDKPGLTLQWDDSKNDQGWELHLPEKNEAKNIPDRITVKVEQESDDEDEGGDINLLEQGKLKGAAFEMVFPIKGGVM